MANIPDWVFTKLQDGIGNYYNDKLVDRLTPTTFLAMLETADGCIRFVEMEYAAKSFTNAIARQPDVAQNEKWDTQTTILKRVYELRDRSGPGGMILHYKERVE